ncbi:MAG: hypothetical protein GXY08_14355 [Ruminococcus sp.]|nr:hypothetical protein [Ruminococcus sp.]
MKRTMALLLSLACICSIYSCGDKKSSNKKSRSSSITGKNSSADEEIKIITVSNWATKDIWNDGFSDISHFLEDGKSAAGYDMDIDFTLDNLKISMEKKEKYTEFINSLDDSIPEQAQLINSWNKMCEQIDILYNKVITEKPKAGDRKYDFNTDLFYQYFRKFYEIAIDMKEPVFK